MDAIDPRITAAIAAHQVCIAAAISEALRHRPDFMATLSGMAEQIMLAGDATFADHAQLAAYKAEASNILGKADEVLTTMHRRSS